MNIWKHLLGTNFFHQYTKISASSGPTLTEILDLDLDADFNNDNIFSVCGLKPLGEENRDLWSWILLRCLVCLRGQSNTEYTDADADPPLNRIQLWRFYKKKLYLPKNSSLRGKNNKTKFIFVSMLYIFKKLLYWYVLIASYLPCWWGRDSHPRVMRMVKHLRVDTGQMSLMVVRQSYILIAWRRRILYAIQAHSGVGLGNRVKSSVIVRG